MKQDKKECQKLIVMFNEKDILIAFSIVLPNPGNGKTKTQRVHLLLKNDFHLSLTLLTLL